MRRAIRFVRRFALPGGPGYFPGEIAGFPVELAERLVAGGVAARVDDEALAATPDLPGGQPLATAPLEPEAHTMMTDAVPKRRGLRIGRR